MNEKQENILNLALTASPEELEKSQELAVGFSPVTNSWDLIIRYNGNLEQVRAIPGAQVFELEGGYAIVNVPKEYVESIANLPEIIFVEKPKALEFAVLNGKRESCINEVQQEFSNETGFFGEGILVGIIDSGIDYTNPAFVDANGKTRILRLWDQVTNQVFIDEQINDALGSDNPYSIVNSRDPSGHGTHVAGIAAGNFAIDKNSNLGIATKSKLVVVKMATASENSFPRTTELMRAVDFIVKFALEINMPLSLNLSFGNNYGSHDGTSLLSTYLNDVADGKQIVIAVGSGNEGDAGSHIGGFIPTNVRNDYRENIEIQVSNFQPSFSIQIWKDFVDIFDFSILSPSGTRILLPRVYNESTRLSIDNTQVLVYYGTPKPYSRYQEIYLDFIPENAYIREGLWTIEIIPEKVVSGRYDLWLPSSASLNVNTRFLRQTSDVTLTEPSAALKVITVGAYDSKTDKIASFSGRGFTRENNQIKPDLVAPGVDIISAGVTNGRTGGFGETARSGTSMATPFVTGAAALMMEWGIVRGNDIFMYGEKVKAYMVRGARKLPEFTTWPNPQAGWGALCVRDSIPM